MESHSEPLDARAALESIAESRRAAADRLVTPWWYHPILGVVLGVYVVAVSLGGTIVSLVAVVILLATLAALTRAYQRVTGIWISGFDSGRARWWAYGMGGFLGACVVASLVLARTDSPTWIVWAIGVVVAVAVIVLGRHYDVVLRADLRGESSGRTA